MKNIYKAVILLAFLFKSNILLSAPVPVYEQDFEDENGGMPVVNAADPVWSLTPIFATLYGAGNQFEVTNTTAHSGTYSLKISYDGRNGFCNTCGTYGTSHKTGLDGVDYFVADTGENLTAQENDATVKENDGPAAQRGRLLYNKTNGFSLWEITDVQNENGTNDKLTVQLLKTGINNEAPEFNGGDDIAIARQCGVDGHVGNDISRRNDCDGAIVWFGNVATQAPGTSIFRRMYLKPEITSPLIHQKLHYLRPGNDADGNAGEIVLFADSVTEPYDIVPHLSGFGAPNNGVYPYRDYGGSNYYIPGGAADENGNSLSAGLKFKRSTWYYVEEQYRAATSSGTDAEGRPIYNADGMYSLWFAEAGREYTDGVTPIIQLNNLTMPPIDFVDSGPKISFWGNIQHWTHLHGNWFIDDVEVSLNVTDNTKIGPVPAGDPTVSKNIATPNVPIVSP